LFHKAFLKLFVGEEIFNPLFSNNESSKKSKINNPYDIDGDSDSEDE